MKPVVVLFYADLSPDEGQHPKHVVGSFLNQKIGKSNPIDFKVIGTVPEYLLEEIKRFDV